VNGKRSKSALRAFLAEEDLIGDASISDPRTAELQVIRANDSAALSAIQEVFAGTSLLNDPAKIRRILRVRSEVEKEWRDARDSFLAVGRALLSLEETLTRAEFVRLRQSTERLFPFSDATATQLRQIARAIDSGRLPQEHCPGSYGTAYQITLLSETQLRVAWERGLIRPDVTRREIMQLRREVQVIEHGQGLTARSECAALQEERKRLVQRRERLTKAIATVERQIAKIDALFSDVPDDAGKATETQVNKGRRVMSASKNRRPRSE
jgi:hypothetical protein